MSFIILQFDFYFNSIFGHYILLYIIFKSQRRDKSDITVFNLLLPPSISSIVDVMTILNSYQVVHISFFDDYLELL